MSKPSVQELMDSFVGCMLLAMAGCSGTADQHADALQARGPVHGRWRVQACAMTSLNRPLRPVVEIGQTWVNSLGRKFVVESIVKTDIGLIARSGGAVMYLACDGRPEMGDWELVSWDSARVRFAQLKLASLQVDRLLQKQADRPSDADDFSPNEMQEAVTLLLHVASALLDQGKVVSKPSVQELMDSFVGCIEVHRDNWLAMAENAKDAGQTSLAAEMLRMADGCENIIKMAKQKWGN